MNTMRKVMYQAETETGELFTTESFKKATTGGNRIIRSFLIDTTDETDEMKLEKIKYREKIRQRFGRK